MDILEIRDIAESLKRRLELLTAAGITDIPKTAKADAVVQGPCPSEWALYTGPLDEAVSFAPCGHEGWKGVLFGVWRLGRAAVVWGVPATGESLHDAPFGVEALSQLEKMLNWLSGEIKAGMPAISNPECVLTARCPQAPDYSDAEASEKAASALGGLIENSMAALLMGPLATWALLRNADLGGARGSVHRKGGCPVVVTWPPDDLLKDQGRKKEAHADLKLLISALGDQASKSFF